MISGTEKQRSGGRIEPPGRKKCINTYGGGKPQLRECGEQYFKDLRADLQLKIMGRVFPPMVLANMSVHAHVRAHRHTHTRTYTPQSEWFDLVQLVKEIHDHG